MKQNFHTISTISYIYIYICATAFLLKHGGGGGGGEISSIGK